MTVHDVKISTKCPVQNPKSIEICRIGGEIYVYMDVHKGILGSLSCKYRLLLTSSLIS